MNRLFTAAVAAAALLCAEHAFAAPQRTFVSTSGNDANTAANCSLVSPCRSFGSALSVTASSGEIVVLDSGGYGRVTIDKSVTITAPAGVYAGISVFSGTNGVDIATAGLTVVLRGLAINGQGGSIGVSFTAGNLLVIENCVIANMNNHGVDAASPFGDVRIRDTTIRSNVGYGVNARNALAYLGLENVRIEGGSSPAMVVSEGASAVIADSRFERNNAGIHVLPGASNTSSLTLVNSVIARNNGDGIYTFASGAFTHANVSMFGGAITGQGTTGLRADSSSSATVWVSISNVAITDNGSDGVDAVSGTGTRVSVGGSTIKGNAGFGLHNGTAAILSRQDNIVHDNNNGSANPQTSGVITFLSGV
jgi:Right handed beta helix region